MNKHDVKSCCCCFVCAVDSSRNKLYDFRAENCLVDVVTTLYEPANQCAEEMQGDERMIMTRDGEA